MLLQIYRYWQKYRLAEYIGIGWTHIGLTLQDNVLGLLQGGDDILPLVYSDPDYSLHHPVRPHVAQLVFPPRGQDITDFVLYLGVDQLPVCQGELFLLLPQPLPELGPLGAHQLVALEVWGITATGELERPPVLVPFSWTFLETSLGTLEHSSLATSLHTSLGTSLQD